MESHVSNKIPSSNPTRSYHNGEWDTNWKSRLSFPVLGKQILMEEAWEGRGKALEGCLLNISFIYERFSPISTKNGVPMSASLLDNLELLEM